MYTTLTKSSMFLIKYVAELLGLLMNGIYWLIEKIGIPNVGLAIILFTIVMYLLMTPMQIKQQRFSKLNNLMSPELKRIQNKYKGKKDQVSQQKQMDETNAVYEKYGVSPMGSCGQMIIQLVVMFALYQVIYKIPGYITLIGNRISSFITDNDSFVTLFTKFVTDTNEATLTRNFAEGATTANVVDAVYGLKSSQWTSLLETVTSSGASYESELETLHQYLTKATSFLTLSISDAPMDIIKSAWSNKQFILIVAAALIPILAWASQVFSMKLMKQPESDPDNAMAKQMQSMNTFMPIMSAFFCLTLPVGVGIYWIAGAVVRAVQMIVINKILDKESMEDILADAQKKADKKRAKKGLPAQKITNSAHISTRTLEAEQKLQEARDTAVRERNLKDMKDSTAYYNNNAKPGSIASKANMVRAYDEKKNSKKK